MRTNRSGRRCAVSARAVAAWLGILVGVTLVAASGAAASGPGAELEALRAEYEALGAGTPDATGFRALQARLLAHADANVAGPTAAEATWLAAEAARRVAQLSLDPAEARIAALLYGRLVREHPDHEHAPAALLATARLEAGLLDEPGRAKKTLRTLVATYPSAGEAETALALVFELAGAVDDGDETSPAARIATLDGIRHWVGPGGAQLILDLSAPCSVQSSWLRAPEEGEARSTLRIELEGARPGRELASRLDVGDGVLEGLSLHPRGRDGTVMTVDLVGAREYEVFALGPHVIVVVRPIDVPNGPPRIVIDPGHGGKDPGASSPRGTVEKELVLSISEALARELRARYPHEVVLTRADDTTLTLEERTAIANTQAADVFVSVHANASRRKGAKGIETYFLAAAGERDAKEVAARENGLVVDTAAADVALDAVLGILNDLAVQRTAVRSAELAKVVHERLVKDLGARHRIEDLGVKQAPFVVLMGAEMPSVLVEVGFLTNPAEERRLRSSDFQRRLARSLAKGLDAYLRGERAPAAEAGG